MWRIAALCWMFTAPALTGASIAAVLTTPALAVDAATWIPVAAVLGFVCGVPAARCVARFLEGPASDESALHCGWSLPPRR